MDRETAQFVRRACETPPLTREQEREAFLKIRAGDKELRHHIVSSNVRLLVSLAQKFANREVGVDDLVQCGVVALYKAVDRFEVDRGRKFSTYATNWVVKEFLILLKSTGTIKVPARLWSLDGPVSPAVLRILSLDDPLRGGESGASTTLGDVVPSPEVEDDAPLAREEKAAQVEKLRAAVRLLPMKLRAAVTLRFGLNGRVPMTLEEVGQELGIAFKTVALRVERAVELLPGLMIEED